MKRLGMMTVVLIIVAAVLFWFSQARDETTLWIGVVPETRSLMMEEEGSFFVTVFFSRSDSMLSEIGLIEEASIVGGGNEATLIVRSIQRSTETVLSQERRYYAFRFEFTFGFQAAEGFQIEWPDAVLSLSYHQADRIELPLGSLAVRIESVGLDSPLSLERLYGRKHASCGIERVLVGLRNQTSESIFLMDWDMGFLGHRIVVERVASEHPEQSTDRLDLFGAPIESETIEIPPGEVRYLVLGIETVPMRPIRHFYLRATWSGMGRVESYWIDDFVYLTEEGGPCDGVFLEIAFHYPS